MGTQMKLRCVIFTFVISGCISVEVSGSWRDAFNNLHQSISTNAGNIGQTDVDDDSDEDIEEGTCPCVKKPKGSSECVSYQENYQAATLEEAILSFKDTTAYDPQRATLISQEMAKELRGTKPGSKEPFNCAASVVCRGCMQVLLEKMEKEITGKPSWGNADIAATNSTRAWINKLKNKLRLNPRDHLKRYCASLENKMNAGSQSDVPTQSDHVDVNTLDMARIVDAIKDNSAHRFRPTGGRDSGAPYTSNEESEYSMEGAGHRRPSWHRVYRGGRSKRQSQTNIGTVSTMSCPYTRGTAIDGGSYCGLCDLCWAWRTLPANYFPRLVNEQQCATNTRCLGGWGTCRPRYRSIDVLFNTGTDQQPSWQPVSLNTPVACECQIEYGSALHNFVKA